MKKITNEKHLKFFDFILPILSKRFPRGESVYDLALKYRKEKETDFASNEAKYFFESYKNEYFTPKKHISNIVITTEAKEIIDTYGSLSKYQKKISQEKQKSTKKENLIKITPIVIAALMLILSIFLGVSNNTKKNKIKNLEREVKTKDTIILELNKYIDKIDTLNIKALKPNNGS